MIKSTISDTDRNSNNTYILPNQRTSSATKRTSKWQKDTLNYYLYNVPSNSSKRKTKEEMQESWNFYNSMVSREEIEESLDPMIVGKEGASDDEVRAFSFYDILKQPFETLIGEDVKRNLEVRAFAINPEIVNEKDRMYKEKVVKTFQKRVQELQKNKQLDKKILQEELENLDKYYKTDLQTAHEKMCNGILHFIQKDTRINAKYKLNRAFLNFEILGEIVLKAFNRSNDPDFRVIDSSLFEVFGLGESNFIEDGYAWKEIRYMNPYSIIEEYGEELSNKEIDRILKADNENSVTLHNLDTGSFVQIPGSEIADADYVSSAALASSKEGFLMMDESSTGYSLTDGEGNLKVTTIEFITLRQIGIRTYIDIDGTEQTDWVDEYYVADEKAGETVKKTYIQEIWEGHIILDDIYVRVRPLPVQMRSSSNPFYVKSSYTGYINIQGRGKVQSRLDRLKVYQRMFNTAMNKLKDLWAQNMGKIAIIDTSRIPSSMNPEEWMYWLKRFKLSFENPFEEGKKGIAKGQLSGNMQQNNRVIDLSLANEIEQAIQMLNWIEEKVNKIAAVPEPRQGNMTGKEGLGVSQQAIVQSSHQTEFDFFISDIVKSRMYELMVEYTKYLWKDFKGKRQFLLDDLTNYILDIDGEPLLEVEVGVKITNSSKMYQVYNELRNLSHAAMQTGTATLSDVARMLLSDTPSEMLQQLSLAEEKRIKQQQEAQQAQLKAQQEQLQAQAQLEQTKFERELEKLKIEHEYRLAEKQLEIEANSISNYMDQNANGINDEVEIKKAELANKMKEKELAVKEKIEEDKIKAQKEIARMKNNKQ